MESIQHLPFQQPTSGLRGPHVQLRNLTTLPEIQSHHARFQVQGHGLEIERSEDDLRLRNSYIHSLSSCGNRSSLKRLWEVTGSAHRNTVFISSDKEGKVKFLGANVADDCSSTLNNGAPLGFPIPGNHQLEILESYARD
ncbi:hypothetical protein MMC10_004735 [Thelotrema lepadinum]|nr:hypothetical protein [Thelotrema lepadinum]